MSSNSCISHFLPLLDKPHLVQQDISPIIEALKQETLVDVQLVGHSYEKRPIHLITFGEGPIVIFAWTQMHGNEATATAAVFDLLNVILTKPAPVLSSWTSAFTLHILPMLNPDGAHMCTRQNAQGIDINRDAKDLQTPEGKVLMQMVEQLAPDICFNLHDQSPYYQCGNSGNPATIAFLAPAFDAQKSIDLARERAMKLIAFMAHKLQAHIHDCVARYDDTYSPRSFGDNIAARKVSTILIESGAARQDSNRQLARSMNLLAITSALEFLQDHTIADQQHASVANYFAIPDNVPDALSTLLLTHLSFGNDASYSAGVSVKQTERYSNKFYVDFIGDLHTQAGLTEYDATGIAYSRGKVFAVDAPTTLNNQQYLTMLAQGFLYFDDPKGLLNNQSDFDVARSQHPYGKANAFVLDQPAYCLFTKSNDPTRVIGAMLNGQLVWLI